MNCQIKVNKLDVLADCLAIVEKNNTARLFPVSMIPKIVDSAEKQLNALHIPKKYWRGCVIHCVPDALPNSYRKYGKDPHGTELFIERKTRQWFVIEIRRTRCSFVSGGRNRKEVLYLSDIAHAAVPRKYSLSL